MTILEGGSFVSEILNSSRIVSCCVTLSSKSKNKHTITEGIMLHLTRFHFSLRLNKIYEETAHSVYLLKCCQEHVSINICRYILWIDVFHHQRRDYIQWSFVGKHDIYISHSYEMIFRLEHCRVRFQKDIV